MTLTVCVIVMLVGLIGMIWCAKKQKSVANAKLYAVVCLAVILVSAVWAMVDTIFGEDIETSRINANQDQFERAKIDAVATYVNKNYDGKKVVILIHESDIPTKANSSYVRVDRVKELKALLKKGVTVLDTVVIKLPPVKEGEEDFNPDDVSRSAKSFNAMFDQCKNLRPDVIIDLAGLPMDGESRKLKIWNWKGKDEPKLILAQADDIGSSFQPADFMTVIDCVIVSRNDRKFNFLEDNAPKELKEAFDSLYVLVTKENIQQLAKDKVISINN